MWKLKNACCLIDEPRGSGKLKNIESRKVRTFDARGRSRTSKPGVGFLFDGSVCQGKEAREGEGGGGGQQARPRPRSGSVIVPTGMKRT